MTPDGNAEGSPPLDASSVSSASSASSKEIASEIEAASTTISSLGASLSRAVEVDQHRGLQPAQMYK